MLFVTLWTCEIIKDASVKTGVTHTVIVYNVIYGQVYFHVAKLLEVCTFTPSLLTPAMPVIVVIWES